MLLTAELEMSDSDFGVPVLYIELNGTTVPGIYSEPE